MHRGLHQTISVARLQHGPQPFRPGLGVVPHQHVAEVRTILRPLRVHLSLDERDRPFRLGISLRLVSEIPQNFLHAVREKFLFTLQHDTDSDCHG